MPPAADIPAARKVRRVKEFSLSAGVDAWEAQAQPLRAAM